VLTQGDILHILQNANSVPPGQPIWNSTEEYNKLKAIIESAIAYTHPVKELTDEEVFNLEQQAYNLAMQVQNQKALIKQLEETQVYLYKTHDADKAEIEALKEQLRFSYDGQ
jgi:hypothetical protein